jgi:hypothetical protein
MRTDVTAQSITVKTDEESSHHAFYFFPQWQGPNSKASNLSTELWGIPNRSNEHQNVRWDCKSILKIMHLPVKHDCRVHSICRVKVNCRTIAARRININYNPPLHSCNTKIGSLVQFLNTKLLLSIESQITSPAGAQQ